MVSRIACMGGWCHLRDSCRLHHAAAAPTVIERICDRGETGSYEPVRIVRVPGSWERGNSTRGLLAPATWMEPIH